jgi:hypothetical protein
MSKNSLSFNHHVPTPAADGPPETFSNVLEAHSLLMVLYLKMAATYSIFSARYSLHMPSEQKKQNPLGDRLRDSVT